MSLKYLFLVSKILFQQRFILWLLVSLVAIPSSLIFYGQDGADFTVLLAVVTFLSMVSMSSVHIARCFPLQPHMKNYVILTAILWSVLFSCLFWYIAIVEALIKLDPMAFFLPTFISLMLISPTHSATTSVPLRVFVWLMRLFLLAGLNSFLYEHVGDSFVYVAIMLFLYLLVIYWQIKSLPHGHITLNKG